MMKDDLIAFIFYPVTSEKIVGQSPLQIREYCLKLTKL